MRKPVPQHVSMTRAGRVREQRPVFYHIRRGSVFCLPMIPFTINFLC